MLFFNLCLNELLCAIQLRLPSLLLVNYSCRFLASCRRGYTQVRDTSKVTLLDGGVVMRMLFILSLAKLQDEVLGICVLPFTFLVVLGKKEAQVFHSLEHLVFFLFEGHLVQDNRPHQSSMLLHSKFFNFIRIEEISCRQIQSRASCH